MATRTATPPGFVSKSKLEILDQEISNERGVYRVRAGDRVHYLTIPTTIFDEDTMGKPFLLIPQRPDFPDTDWTRMTISRDSDGALTHAISYDPLPQLKFPFHENLVDILSLPVIIRLRYGVHQVLYQDRPAIAKYSCFNWDFYRIERENMAYAFLHNDHDPSQPLVAPQVLGHLTESDRPIGLLLEKIEGRFASIEDVEECQKASRSLHAEPLRLIHGDVNRFNFIISSEDGRARLIDFEHAEDYDEDKAPGELGSIPFPQS